MKVNLIALSILATISQCTFSEDLGKTTYEIACKNCHAPELAPAIKSPAAFDKKAWKLRFDQAKIEAKNNPKQFPTPMDYLLYSVKIGKGLMHHGGLCNELDDPKKDCSDAAFIAAIQYMSEQD